MTPRRREVEALEASLGDKVMALDGRVGALQATSLADAEKTYAKGATAAEVNATQATLKGGANATAASEHSPTNKNNMQRNNAKPRTNREKQPRENKVV